MAGDQTLELLRDLRESLRDSAQAAALHAENTAVTNDRLGRVLDAHAKLQKDHAHLAGLLARLDSFILREEAAQALARATADLAASTQKAGVNKILSVIGDGLASAGGQRILLVVLTLLAAWAGGRLGVDFKPPAPAPVTPAPVPLTIGAEHAPE